MSRSVCLCLWSFACSAREVVPPARARLAETPALTITGSTAAAALGGGVGSDADLNGDGLADLVVSGDDLGDGAAGVQVYLGVSGGVPSTLAGTLAISDLTRMRSAGDVDGDGDDELILGGWGEDYEGVVHLYAGAPEGMSTTTTLTLSGPEPWSGFGLGLDGAGDVNGDGYDDVIVGADTVDSGHGKAWVYLGSASGLLAEADQELRQKDAGSFGCALAGLGDVNGDGYGDVAVGADATPSRNAGAVYVYLGGPDGLASEAQAEILGADENGYFGALVRAAGDVNGDGYDDLIAGSYVPDTYTGLVQIHLGGPDGVDSEPSQTLRGAGPQAVFAYDGAGAGDVDADGYDDLWIGACEEDARAGAVYLYRGGPDGVAETPDFSVRGAAAGDYLGCAVSGGGDLDGDGVTDVVVSAVGAASGAGEVRVYLGVAEAPAEDTADSGSADSGDSVDSADSVDSGGTDSRASQDSGSPGGGGWSDDDKGAGCGCAGAPVVTGWGALALVGVLAAARRRPG